MALALSKNPALNIAVLDKSTSSSHARVSAIALGSKHFLDEFGLWESLAASPYLKMYVWDQNSKGKIEFNCSDLSQPALGFIVEDNLIRNALLKKVKEKNNIELFAPITLESIRLENQCLLKTTSNLFSCQLIIGADGAQSWVREHVGIKNHVTDYQHKAITATVNTQLAHQNTAWQCFTPSGPLAFLPLNDPHQCSIVWSTNNEYADELLALDDEQFQKKLTDVFKDKLGAIIQSGPRTAFPLKMHHAKNYVLPHVALAGDAAHSLHPLAGQGVNLGLQDVSCLTTIILSALEKKRDYSSLPILRKYERARRSENTIMLSTVDGLKSLFASEKKWVGLMRGAGLNFINKTSFVKNFIMRHAMSYERII